jgi:hypothetical protein
MASVRAVRRCRNSFTRPSAIHPRPSGTRARLSKRPNLRCQVAQDDRVGSFPLKPPKEWDKDGNVVVEEDEETVAEIMHDLSVRTS